MAKEGPTFVLVTTQVLTTAENREKNKLTEAPFVEVPGSGFAMIFGPDSAPLVDPLPPGEEGILYADIDLSTINFSKQTIDVVGHYSVAARPAELACESRSGKASHYQTMT